MALFMAGRARARRMLASLIGLALFTLALGGSISHVALVRHEICAEHGQLVEHWGDEHAPGEEHTHEAHEPQKHCSILLATAITLPSPFAQPFASEPIVYVVADVAASFSRLPDASPPEHRLLVAPKTSPPRA